MDKTLLDLGYFIGSVLLIEGLRKLSNPATARFGNLLAAMGMILGIFISLIYPVNTGDGNYFIIFAALALGTIIGWVSSARVAMTAMPEMVSIFNGFGGFCAMMICLVWYNDNISLIPSKLNVFVVSLNLFMGCIAFIGSMVAYGKLDGFINDKKFRLPKSQLINAIILLISIFFIYLLTVNNEDIKISTIAVFTLISLIYGITFVLPIGGADMPVVISLLNSITGITAAISGIIAGDKLMLLGGVLVGSAGTILTLLMCKAMNRSLLNVIVGSFSGKGGAGFSSEGKSVKEVNISDLAIMLSYCEKVAVVPGYGLAVSQAQKLCKELENALLKKSVEVKYAIHPVAGRMPGHMNVLLAEADIEYSKLLDLDDANTYLEQTDVAIVIGANDVVNPSAKEDPSSNIYGMPILDLSKTKNVIVIKRSMSAGYAGIQNPLFYKDNTKMLFADAKDALQKVIEEIKLVS